MAKRNKHASSIMVGGAFWGKYHNASPRGKKNCPHHKMSHCYRWREGDEFVPQWHGDEFVQRLFLLACFSGGDAEVLEDFSPLSTNATYWKTRRDTREGSKAPCPLRDACSGCAKGKYSQITGEGG